jgi:hypothetical protein
MQAHRFRAPKEDGAILAEPPLDRAPELLNANRTRLASWDHDFQGRRFSVLREKTRADAFDAARRYHETAGLDLPSTPDPDRPVVVTGHQPELFHPGVWVKNFAVFGIAAASGGTGLNLIVDNDIPKGARIRVPDGSSPTLKTKAVAFDNWAGEVPFEDQPIRDRGLFDNFPGRIHAMLGGLVAHPLVDRFWSHVETTPEPITEVGRYFARARRLIEAEWGVRNWEVPLSDLCETDGFRWFACHLLAHLPRFQTVHNDALNRYRALYHIRSKNHPVAALDREGEWLEAPFWVWRKSEPRRHPLQVRQLARTMELKIGGESFPFLTLPLGPDREACCAVEALATLPALGIRLRTRALTTTMFARLLVGDLFVHGIGGAKYDELGDEVARGFFRIDPPDFLTLSMTLHLGLPTSRATAADLLAAGRRIRDLSWQPERFLTPEARAGAAELLQRKRSLIAGEPMTREERIARYEALRIVNTGLAALVADQLPGAVAERAALLQSLGQDSVARSREYSLVLHDERRIRDVMTQLAGVSRA